MKVQMGLNMWYRWSQGLAEGLDLRGREELLLVLSLSTWEKALLGEMEITGLRGKFEVEGRWGLDGDEEFCCTC